MVENKLALQYSEDKLLKLILWFKEQRAPSEYNHVYIVENVRTLTEFLVYGEKYDTGYFETFIDSDVLQGDLVRFLTWNKRLRNIQIIQTTSMLIQNIETKTRMFYLLGNPFLNLLISYDFGFARDDELVDYYVNFLKSLTLKLDSETVNFFFNDRLKTFPLYQ